MNYFLRSLLLILFALNFLESKATHIMGGEITWECDANGGYVFELVVYRDCSGIGHNASNDNLKLIGHSSIDNIPVQLISSTDISENCNSAGPSANCGAGPPFASLGGPYGTVQMNVYKSAPIQLGVAGSNPWIVLWSHCCRGANNSNLFYPVALGYTLRSYMYGPPASQNPPQSCYDSSPKFLEEPITTSMAGKASTESVIAMDKDADSLFYFLAPSVTNYMGLSPFQEGVNPEFVPYVAPFSASAPFPGSTHHPMNVQAQIDGATGLFSYTSHTTGQFTYDIGIESYKGSHLTAKIYRTFSRFITPDLTNSNSPPNVILTDLGSSVSLNQNGNSYFAKAIPGDFLQFNLSSTDLDLIQVSSAAQTIVLTPSGNNFSNPIDSVNSNCLLPPCASLMPGAGQNGFVNQSTNNADFSWQIDFNHLNGNSTNGSYGNTYAFSFEFSDDFCPIPARNTLNVVVNVKFLPPFAPRLNFVSMTTNNDMSLHYTPSTNPGDYFEYFLVYFQPTNDPNQTYYVVDTIYSLTDSIAVFSPMNQNGSGFYFIQSDNAYGLSGPTSDTLFFDNAGNTSEFAIRTLYASANKETVFIGGMPDGLNDIDILSVDGRLIGSIKGHDQREIRWKTDASLSKGMYLILVKNGQKRGRVKCIIP